MFQFHDPSPLLDDDLVLVLCEECPGDPTINYVPAYTFKMMLRDQSVSCYNDATRFSGSERPHVR
jgi:hypothetical protein